MIFKCYGYETILNPRSCCPYTGKEQVDLLGDGIKLFFDEFGSKRFVLYINGRSVSALQLMVEGDIVRVANVITVEKHRRKGYARKVWSAAKELYPVIHHSQHLSEDGKIFAARCK